jgi:hypothetical protein
LGARSFLIINSVNCRLPLAIIFPPGSSRGSQN